MILGRRTTGENGSSGAGVTASLSSCAGCGAPLGRVERLGGVALAPCAACGTRTAVPRPARDEAIALHNSNEYFEKTYFEARRGRDGVTQRRVRLLLDRLARELPELAVKHGRLLDIGCDTGDFLVAAQQLADVVPFGVDVSGRAVAIAVEKGVTAVCGELGSAPPSYSGFTLVTAIDVIEHVPQPEDLLVEARRRLAPTGVVYIETPNWRSGVYVVGRVAARHLHDHPRVVFERLFPPEHLQYFTPRGLQALAGRAGYRVVSMSSRPLRGEALAGSLALRAVMELLQLPDRLLGREILLSAVLVPKENA